MIHEKISIWASQQGMVKTILSNMCKCLVFGHTSPVQPPPLLWSSLKMLKVETFEMNNIHRIFIFKLQNKQQLKGFFFANFLGEKQS